MCAVAEKPAFQGRRGGAEGKEGGGGGAAATLGYIT